MEQPLVNPNFYVVGYVKQISPKFAGGKVYLAKLGDIHPLLIGRIEHKRASEAEKEAVEWKARLVREYDEAVLAMVNQELAA
jgi:hypothetical protein